MAASTRDGLVGSLDREERATFIAFGSLGVGLPEVTERSTSSRIAFARRQMSASAYVENHYVEAGIELLRTVYQPRPRAAFATSTEVTIHRNSLRDLEQFVESITSPIHGAADTVAPGTRRAD